MKSILKFLAKSFIIILCVQLSGFLIVGINVIHRKIATKESLLDIKIQGLAIYTKEIVAPIDQLIVKENLKKKGINSEFFNSEVEYQNYLRQNLGNCGISYKIKFSYPFTVCINSSISCLFNGFLSENRYIWIIYDWFLIK